MRTVGHHKERQITFSASGDLLEEGARFNDEMHRLPTGNSTFIAKGVYRFKNFEEANQQDIDGIVKSMTQAALNRT
jgi:hypothetical protein